MVGPPARKKDGAALDAGSPPLIAYAESDPAGMVPPGAWVAWATEENTMSRFQNAIKWSEGPNGRAVVRALGNLVGLPAGGWGETMQAIRRIEDEIPYRYVCGGGGLEVVYDLVDHHLKVDHAGRYTWK